MGGEEDSSCKFEFPLDWVLRLFSKKIKSLFLTGICISSHRLERREENPLVTNSF